MLRALLSASGRYRLTREDLIAETGLARATVNNVLELAEARGLVGSASVRGAPGGALSFELKARVGYLIGVEFSHNRVTTGIADMTGRLVEPLISDKPADEGEKPPDRDAHGSLDRAARHVKKLMEKVGAEPEEIAAVAVALAGPVDPSTDLLRPMEGPWRSAMTNWLEVRAASQLRARCRFEPEPMPFDTPPAWAPRFFVGNDANFAALSTFELARDKWDGVEDLTTVAYVKWSAGIGSGLVINGALHRGHRGMAGEIGHLPLFDYPVREDAPGCPRCGRPNCVEFIASYDAMKRAEGLEDLSRQEFEEDPRGRACLLDTARLIGRGVAPLVNALNPQLLVVGGPSPDLYPEIIPRLEEGLAEGALEAARRDVQLRLDNNTNVAVVHGAVLYARDEVALPYLDDKLERVGANGQRATSQPAAPKRAAAGRRGDRS